MTIVVHRKAPPLPFVPEELHGKPVVMVICCWAGDVEEGRSSSVRCGSSAHRSRTSAP